MTAGPAAPEPSPAPAGPFGRGRRLAMTLAALAFGGILLGWWQARSMRKLTSAPLATVVVMPFGSPSPEGAAAARILRRRLAALPGVAVIPEEALAPYAGRGVEAGEAAARLGASIVIEGEALEREGSWLVSARAASVARGKELWSGRAVCKGQEPSGCIEPLVRGIAGALRVPYAPAPQP